MPLGHYWQIAYHSSHRTPAPNKFPVPEGSSGDLVFRPLQSLLAVRFPHPALGSSAGIACILPPPDRGTGFQVDSIVRMLEWTNQRERPQSANRTVKISFALRVRRLRPSVSQKNAPRKISNSGSTMTSIWRRADSLRAPSQGSADGSCVSEFSFLRC